jgi:hypothetical protein
LDQQFAQDVANEINRLKLDALTSLGSSNHISLKAFKKAKALADYARFMTTYSFPSESLEEVSE